MLKRIEKVLKFRKMLCLPVGSDSDPILPEQPDPDLVVCFWSGPNTDSFSISNFYYEKNTAQFEREEGSLESFESCLRVVKMKMEKVKARREKEGHAKQETEAALQEKVEKKKVEGLEVCRTMPFLY